MSYKQSASTDAASRGRCQQPSLNMLPGAMLDEKEASRQSRLVHHPLRLIWDRSICCRLGLEFSEACMCTVAVSIEPRPCKDLWCLMCFTPHDNP